MLNLTNILSSSFGELAQPMLNAIINASNDDNSEIRNFFKQKVDPECAYSFEQSAYKNEPLNSRLKEKISMETITTLFKDSGAKLLLASILILTQAEKQVLKSTAPADFENFLLCALVFKYLEENSGPRAFFSQSDRNHKLAFLVYVLINFNELQENTTHDFARKAYECCGQPLAKSGSDTTTTPKDIHNWLDRVVNGSAFVSMFRSPQNMSNVIDLLSDTLKSVIFAGTQYAPVTTASAEATTTAASITEGPGLHVPAGKRRSAVTADMLLPPTSGK